MCDDTDLDRLAMRVLCHNYVFYRNVYRQIELLRRCEIIKESEVKILCSKAR